MTDGPLDRIYLDHNATTPVFPEVVDAMCACWGAPYLNPASQHVFGRRARRVLEDCRDRVADLLGANTSGANADRVIFTSGGTEANNLAIRGLLERPGTFSSPSSRPQFIISAIEHPSIAALANQLSNVGWQVDRLKVDVNGVIRIDDLTRQLRPETGLVATMLANNETGVLQPLAELAAICNERGVPLHTDAAQAIGKVPISFQKWGVATMSIAAHKFGGPLGIGALVIRGDVHISPLLFGGFQQGGTRPGTESVALAVGMCHALEIWQAKRTEFVDRLRHLRERFENTILVGYPEAVIIGDKAERLPHVSNIAFVGLDRQRLFLALDQVGIACSTGSACASGSSEPSPVHIAMGCEAGVILSALRFSFGVDTTAEHGDDAARRILRVCNDLRRQNHA
ncbi:MAG TPA: cysteine desulfurase family protein [Lacipirellulaceae bacterium]|nr:cysteine desulfurase family protein [Lacipirellulaceae bacterium]